MNIYTISLTNGKVETLNGLRFIRDADGVNRLDDELITLKLGEDMQSDPDGIVLDGFIKGYDKQVVEDTTPERSRDKIVIYFRIRNDRSAPRTSIETATSGHRPFLNSVKNEFSKSLFYVLFEGTWIMLKSGSLKYLYFCEGGELLMFDISRQTWPQPEDEPEVQPEIPQHASWFRRLNIFRKRAARLPQKRERKIRFV